MDKLEIDLGPACQVWYQPTWLPFKEALRLFDALQAAIPFEQHRVIVAGSSVPQARLTCWFGDGSYTYSGLTIQPKPWIPELPPIRDRLSQELSCNFNSLLANYYRDGNDRVSWHADDERAIGPIIASVSLGSMRKFGIKNRSLGKAHDIDLQAGSLLVMAGETQKHCLHCISPTKQAVGPRINLTFRIFTK